MRIRQIVFAVHDLARGAQRLAALLGLDAPFRDPAVGEFGLDNAVFVFGDQFIEIVSPLRAGTTAGRLLERRGDSGYMLILQTTDFDAARARLAALQVRTVWSADLLASPPVAEGPRGSGLPAIRAMHLHPKDIGGAIVSIDEPKPSESWRWGGPHWRPQPGARGAQRVTGVTIDADAPQAMATRWAQVLGLAAPAQYGNGWRLALHEGHVDFVAAGARGEGISGYTLAVADKAGVLGTARDRGLATHDTAIDLFGTRITLQG